MAKVRIRCFPVDKPNVWVVRKPPKADIRMWAHIQRRDVERQLYLTRRAPLERKWWMRVLMYLWFVKRRVGGSYINWITKERRYIETY